MSAIENCRTAALGGYVAPCEDCSHIDKGSAQPIRPATSNSSGPILTSMTREPLQRISRRCARYGKRPFGDQRPCWPNLSRYTRRVAISNTRLIANDAAGVTFKYKDYCADGPARHKVMTLDTSEFIRRFLIHGLPRGWHRIRHYGLFGPQTAL